MDACEHRCARRRPRLRLVCGKPRQALRPGRADRPAGPGHHYPRAAGVIGAVVPWNFPLDMAAWKLAPALAAGNSVGAQAGRAVAVLRPAPGRAGPGGGDAGRRAEAWCRASAAGRQGPRPAPGGGRTGVHRLHRGRQVLHAVFRAIQPQAGLAGVAAKSPNLVFADCPRSRPGGGEAAFGIFFNQGEVCSANSRLLVERSIHDEFVERLLAKARDWQPGDPAGPGQPRRRHRRPPADRRDPCRHRAGARRGRDLLGGGRQLTINGSDNFIEPTLFGDVRPDMQLACEEIFGPVLAISAFDSEDEAIRLGQRQPLRPRRLAVERRPRTVHTGWRGA